MYICIEILIYVYKKELSINRNFALMFQNRSKKERKNAFVSTYLYLLLPKKEDFAIFNYSLIRARVNLLHFFTINYQITIKYKLYYID